MNKHLIYKSIIAFTFTFEWVYYLSSLVTFYGWTHKVFNAFSWLTLILSAVGPVAYYDLHISNPCIIYTFAIYWQSNIFIRIIVFRSVKNSIIKFDSVTSGIECVARPLQLVILKSFENSKCHNYIEFVKRNLLIGWIKWTWHLMLTNISTIKISLISVYL